MAQPLIQETSAGGVLIQHSKAQFQACLILRGRHGRRVWSLPKGHVEPNESTLTATLREVREETGWTAEIIAELGTITYQVLAPEERTRRPKTVTFLMRAIEQQGAHDSAEVIETRWFSLEEAVAHVIYENERQVLHRAVALLATPEISARFNT